MNSSQAIIAISSLFTKYGSYDYIGEEISQIEHAIQTAKYQEDHNYSQSDIISAFLHDIGHLVVLDKTQENCDTTDTSIWMTNGEGQVLGAQNHSQIGADFLKSLGFSDQITIPVANHCRSKRYLLTTQPKYQEKVSQASLETFIHQGGMMSQEEIEEFEKSPYFEESVRLRIADDNGKNTNMMTKEEVEEYKKKYLEMIKGL